VGTRRLHVVGTSLFLLCLALTPALVMPILGAGLVGVSVFPLLRHLDSGLPEFAVMGAVFVATAFAATRSWPRVLSPLVVAYGFAWLGHFAVEHNRPATFIYPAFSLLGAAHGRGGGGGLWSCCSPGPLSPPCAGDFRMMWDMATGALPL
jgi:hypothetical protein